MKKTPGKKGVASGPMSTNLDQDSITISSDEEAEENNAADKTIHKDKESITRMRYDEFCNNESLMSTYCEGYGNDYPVMCIKGFTIHDNAWRPVDLLADKNDSLRVKKYITGSILGVDETVSNKVSYRHFTLLFICPHCPHNKHKS